MDFSTSGIFLFGGQIIREFKEGLFECSICHGQYDSIVRYSIVYPYRHGFRMKSDYRQDEACFLGLPHTIKRPFHKHNLQFAHSRPKTPCALCEIQDPIFSSFYECENCDYTVHLRCCVLISSYLTHFIAMI